VSIRKRIAQIIWGYSSPASEECKRGKGQLKPKTLSRILGPDEAIEHIPRGGFGRNKHRE
jgi:hypothetical protein